MVFWLNLEFSKITISELRANERAHGDALSMYAEISKDFKSLDLRCSCSCEIVLEQSINNLFICEMWNVNWNMCMCASCALCHLMQAVNCLSKCRILLHFITCLTVLPSTTVTTTISMWYVQVCKSMLVWVHVCVCVVLLSVRQFYSWHNCCLPLLFPTSTISHFIHEIPCIWFVYTVWYIKFSSAIVCQSMPYTYVG